MIRAMLPGDLPAVLVIELQSHITPWTEKIFMEELDREWARLMVVEQLSDVVAFCNYWLVADELHLLNICCATEHRRQGHAEGLMHHIIETAKQRNCRLITLEVRTHNHAAIAMYQRLAFENAGIRPGYYADTKEDAQVMLLYL